MTRVAIAGVGIASTDGAPLSHGELLFRAVKAACDDAGVGRDQVTSAVTTSYDFVEGRPLSNQFTLDAVGGVMKPCDLRLGDTALHGLVGGVVEGLAYPGGVTVVASVLLDASDRADDTEDAIQEVGYEPILLRPIIAGTRRAEALMWGMAARAYMADHGTTEEELAELAAAESGRGNGGCRTREEILASPPVAGPLREGHLAPRVDLAAAVILSTDPPDGRRRATITGVGWAAVSAHLGQRKLSEAEATRFAAERAFSSAGIANASAADRVELANAYTIDEVLAAEALGLGRNGRCFEALLDGKVNPTGGSQGDGWARGTSSLVQLARAVEALSDSGDGGHLVCQTWGGFAGSSAAVVVIETGDS